MMNLARGRSVQSSFSRIIHRNGKVGFAKADFGSDESGRFSYGLNSALAGIGVIVKDKAFRNLEPLELLDKGAVIPGSLSRLPIYLRNKVSGSEPKLSKAQFSKLLKQVNAKVRVVSDCPTAVLNLSNVLWKTSARAISHDSCPITVYVATSISPDVRDFLSLGAQSSSDFIAADVERSSLILCGKAFADINGTKEALAALSAPVISARGGLLLSGRLLVSNGFVVLLFAPEDVICSCEDRLISPKAGVILSSQCVAPSFRTGTDDYPNLLDIPAAVVLAVSDITGTSPSLSRLTPEETAYHYVAGYEDGKFSYAHLKVPSSIDVLKLAEALSSKLKDHQISSYLVNTRRGGKNLLNLIDSVLSGMDSST
ncbi:PREDICTED: uncharacterized protein LOC104821739 isoform X2 [Tarenaya hassleriana]|uniref:uncharacterized protein LOC104821739 isoform X2 n=1 Tax=Tarenaya hassleriana TaxID=28532 RepID=UPI00053C80F5|nr:PREDICTED: uncharacterized protein LOC104821739 isoform X2 [Tarenaya hassleriana]